MSSQIHCVSWYSTAGQDPHVVQEDDPFGSTSDHPIDCLDECLNFVGEATDHVGRVVDKLNNRIDMQDIQIEQLANMVNDLVGTVEGQAKEIKQLKSNQETQRKVLNNLTAKFITLEECVEDIQKKAFPKVRGKDS